jgi:formylglycine-generating enzyme required for sulfatase activity
MFTGGSTTMFKPWMDEKDIYPGEQWQGSIERAIEHADFFLACLSTHAVSGRGFLPREIATALERWRERLHSDIYLIPARLEPCEVPDVLSNFQWVDLYQERGWTRLVRALQVGLERRQEMSRSAVRESSPPVSTTPADTRPAHPEGTTPQSPPARTSTAVPPDVRHHLDLMRSSHLEARKRVAAGNALAQQGDPRFRADAWYLPDEPLLGFIEIPAGPFLMGSDKAHDSGAYDEELPQREVALPRYFIGRYPVTVPQFRAFVERGGIQPVNLESLQGLANHPVVSVTWYELLRYCAWLTERLRAWLGTPEPLATLLRKDGWQVSLPSEAQWEKAARSTDGRIYPWGNDPDPNRANYAFTRIGAKSAVGCFPSGASPYGVEDLSGNVWEWTRSLWADYPYPAGQSERAAREDLKADRDIPRVLRGGAFASNLRLVRCACRNWGATRTIRAGHLGFRVVVLPVF